LVFSKICYKIALYLFHGQLLLFLLFLPIWLRAAEIKLVTDSPKPEVASSFKVYVVSGGIDHVLGIDLRFDFNSEIVEFQDCEVGKIASLQWVREQNDPQHGYAITGLMFPTSGQTIDFAKDDTLAALTFLRLKVEHTSIDLKKKYPILIDPGFIPIACSVSPAILCAVTSVAKNDNVLTIEALDISNYPNPFNPETQFVFVNNQGSQPAVLDIYDDIGRMIWQKRFVASPGINRITWNGVDLEKRQIPVGAYFYRLSIGHQIAKGKCVIIR